MKTYFNYTNISKNKVCRQAYPVFGKLEKDIIYTFSGKSSLAILLRYFRQTGDLKDKSEQLLVPAWLGNWVYMTAQKFCFPTTVFNPKVKGMLVYHQWGFPQRMELILDFCKKNKLFCIEDCAHAFESYYQGKRLGTFGDAAIFSLAKFFPSVVGGAIYSKSKKIIGFVKQTIKEDNSVLTKKAFKERIIFDKNQESKKNLIMLERNYSIYDKLLKCPSYSLEVSRQQVINKVVETRKNNFKIIGSAFIGYEHMKQLMAQEVTPWVVPLFLGANNQGAANVLKKNGIECGVFNFDINQNMLKPNFIECLTVPCHQGLNRFDISNIISLIKGVIKK